MMPAFEGHRLRSLPAPRRKLPAVHRWRSEVCRACAVNAGRTSALLWAPWPSPLRPVRQK